MIISPSLYPLIAALLANVAAQVLKLFNFYFRSGRWDLHQVISCGGFPSSHSSTVTALSLAIGLQEGFTSPFFAITCIFAFIVIYDAVNVRYYAASPIRSIMKRSRMSSATNSSRRSAASCSGCSSH